MLNFKKIFKTILLLSLPLLLQANPYTNIKNLLSTNNGAKQFLLQNKGYEDFFDLENIYPENLTFQEFDFILKQKLLQLSEQEKINPICLLIECDADHCKLTRTHEGEYTRHILENRILEYTKKQFPNKNQNIVITDLGSGGLFQNLIIITKLLNEGYNNLTINLIDNCYQDYCSSKEDPVYMQTLKNANNFDGIHRAIFNHHIFRQYYNYLKQNFPSANIQINIFEEMVAYMEDTENHPEIKTDILLSIDTIESDSTENIIDSLVCFYISDALKVNGLVFLCFDAENIDCEEEIGHPEELKRNVITIFRKECEPVHGANFPDAVEYLPILMHNPEKPDYLSNYQIIESYIIRS